MHQNGLIPKRVGTVMVGTPSMLNGPTPRRYTLRFVPDQPAIEVLVQPDCISAVKTISLQTPQVGIVAARHGLFNGLLESFSGDLGSPYFGFNRSITRSGNEGDRTVFSIPFPCKRDGEGKAMYATVASLSLFFGVLNDCRISAPKPQLIEVHSLMKACSVDDPKDLGSTSLSGHLGSPVCDFIRAERRLAMGDCTNHAVTSMRTTWRHVTGQGSDHAEGCRFACTPFGLRVLMDCPPHDCSVQTNRTSVAVGKGVELISTKVTAPNQALAFLAGLSAFTHRVEQHIS